MDIEIEISRYISISVSFLLSYFHVTLQVIIYADAIFWVPWYTR